MSERMAGNTIAHYFNTRIPAMLDGAVLRGRGRLSLRKKKTVTGQLSPEILRETLDAVAATPEPKTMAGAAPVSPRHARVWWDGRVLENLEDILARLDAPRLVLRFYDVTGLDPEAGRRYDSFDLDVELHEKGKTVHFWSSGRSYVVDLGYTHSGGRFLRLARTNAIDLPRDSKGELRPEETATSRLSPGLSAAAAQKAACTAPDAAAREWAAARPDSESRDENAELVIHMLYRAFLLEGPRALRRVPKLTRRDPDVLRSEFAQRQRRAEAALAAEAVAARRVAPAFLVQRLDAAPAAVPQASLANPPVVAATVSVPEQRAVNPVVAERFGDGDEFLRRPYISVAGAELPSALFATSVFEAARNLRKRLAGIRPVDPMPVSSRSLERFPATETTQRLN